MASCSKCLLIFIGIYYEEGCAHKFPVWLKAWAGVVGVLNLIIISLEVRQFVFIKAVWIKMRLYYCISTVLCYYIRHFLLILKAIF